MHIISLASKNSDIFQILQVFNMHNDSQKLNPSMSHLNAITDKIQKTIIHATGRLSLPDNL
jgi:hypothetical protein